MHKVKYRQRLQKAQQDGSKSNLPSSMFAEDSPKEKETTKPEFTDDEVVSFYHKASSVLNEVLESLFSKIKPDAAIYDLCVETDELILSKSGGDGGIAFPTCLSANEKACHFSPLKSDAEAKDTLKDGDLLKIEIGVHHKGFPVLVATTIVVGASKTNKVTGRVAKLLKGGYDGAKLALENMKVGTQNTEISSLVNDKTKELGINLVEGMVSYKVDRNTLEGDKQIIFNMQEETKKRFKKASIEHNEVYVIDVVVTTGQGKIKVSEFPTRVFKCHKNTKSIPVKMESSNKFVKEATKNFGTFPFALRQLKDERVAKIGSSECSKNGCVEAYHVMSEKSGEFVAQFMFTCLVQKEKTVELAFPKILGGIENILELN